MGTEYFSVNASKYETTKNFLITAPSSLNNPHDNSVMFCTKEHINDAYALDSVRNCIVFWPSEIEVPASITARHLVIPSKDPRQALAVFFADNDITYYPEQCEYEIVNGAYVAKGAVIGKNVKLFPGAYIDSQTIVGDDCYIGSGAKLLGKTRLGRNVMIRENAVIGCDGLSTMRKQDGSAATIPQFGGVVLEDNVQVGANTVIARGAIDDTVIHRGCKIDNLCFISHNVQLGADTFVVGETIMFGSSSTGEQAYISGNATIREGIHVGSKALVGMGAVVVKSVPNGAVVMGNPAKQR